MCPWSYLFADMGVPGVPMEHMNAVPCIVFTPIVALTIGVIVRSLSSHGVGWASRFDGRLRRLTGIDKTALVIVLMAGAVKCAVAPTHWVASKPWHYLITNLAYPRTMAYAFVLDAIAFFVAALVLLVHRSWGRFLASASCLVTAMVYTAYMVYGWESADPVGVTITVLEVTGGLLLLVQAYRRSGVETVPTSGQATVAGPAQQLVGVGVGGGDGYAPQAGSAAPTWQGQAGGYAGGPGTYQG